MAYNRGERFSPSPKYHKFLDPGAYQHECPLSSRSHRNPRIKAPFLQNAPRKTSATNPMWTDALYGAMPYKIVPNCSTLNAKLPRFPYEAFSEKDIEELLCRCGLDVVCKCPTEGEEETKPEEILCQGKVRTTLFKGSIPKPKTDDTYESSPLKFKKDPPIPGFYDTRVKESTAFYHGWKWSRRTSKRESKTVPNTFPGPAHYNVTNVNLCGQKDVCAEKIQFYRKKKSRQLRYIDQLTQQNLREDQPGPGSYDPKLPKGTELQVFGPQCDRFPTSKYNLQPGPTEYQIKRDFDPYNCTDIKPCLAKLPERPCFGNKAARFKHRIQIGPSPAEYSVKKNICHVVHCNKAPFGSSVARFKTTQIDNSESTHQAQTSDSDDNDDEEKCPKPTWSFRSKVKRLKSLRVDYNSPSPADLPQSYGNKKQKSKLQQRISPFMSSDMRFNPWFNWVPMSQGMSTPGPCYYNAEKVKCRPAVYFGPLNRTCRFKSHQTDVPAPNTYKVYGGIDDVLHTHNKHLLDNLHSKKDQFRWEAAPPPKITTYRDRELKLLLQCISILDFGEDIFKDNTIKEHPKKVEVEETGTKKKLLSWFLYKHYFNSSF